jgi:hypothetical protein
MAQSLKPITVEQLKDLGLNSATAYKINSLRDQDGSALAGSIKTMQQEKKTDHNDGGESGCDHTHMTMFSTWSLEFRSIISECYKRLYVWLGKPEDQDDSEDTKVPLWFAILSVLVFPIILLVPIAFNLDKWWKNVKKLWNDIKGEETKLTGLTKALLLLTAGLGVLIIPMFASRESWLKSTNTHKHVHPHPWLKLLARSIVLFASLGTGFIALSAIIATPLGAIMGSAVWLFFVAGFLSEWQTLEVSTYQFFANVADGHGLWMQTELKDKIANRTNQYWGITDKKNKLTFAQWSELSPHLTKQKTNLLRAQTAALIFSVGMGIGIFALAITHTTPAVLGLIGAATLASAPWSMSVLIGCIAIGTAIAYTCLVYRGIRDAIYNENGDHLLGAWFKTLYQTYQDSKGIYKLKAFGMGICYLAMAALVIFYIATAGPTWFKAAKSIYHSRAAAIAINIFYYPAMLIFYSSACQTTIDALAQLGRETINGVKNIASKSFTQAIVTITTGAWKALFVIPLCLLEVSLKISCFLILDLALTMGMFILHLLGDAAVGAEEGSAFGLSCGWVLAIDGLSHFFTDFGFIVEWASGELTDDHHESSPPPLPTYEVSIPYALCCLTIVIPLIHGICASLFGMDTSVKKSLFPNSAQDGVNETPETPKTIPTDPTEKPSGDHGHATWLKVFEKNKDKGKGSPHKYGNHRGGHEHEHEHENEHGHEGKCNGPGCSHTA